LVIAGSLPRGVDISFVDELIELAAMKNCKVIINMKEDLISLLKNNSSIFLVKPDVRDVCTYLGQSLNDQNNLKSIAENEVERGADYFVINCGDFNYLIATRNRYIEVTAKKKPKEMKNSLALGDSFIAAFLKSLLVDNKSVEKSAEYGLAAAMATSRNIYNYPDSPAAIERYLNNVHLRYLK
jgi:fructose-1-phosphate kinase PfkB-like protein